MKAFRFLIMPVVLFFSLLSKVYAGTPAYIKKTAYLSTGSGIEGFFKTIYYIVMFALILGATYYVTKFLAKKGMVQSKTKMMKLIESMPIGVDRSLHLVKVGNQVFLLGSASKNLFMISEIEQDKLFEESAGDAFKMDGLEFENYEDSMEAKDFSSYLSSVKGNLHKLKSMVRGNNNNEIK